MGISKKFLKEQMKKLEVNYGKDKFIVDPAIFNLWYEMFADCNESSVRLAVDRCIKENEFAPNIAGVMKYYRAVEEEKSELKEITQTQYKKMLYVWGEQFDLDTYKAIVAYVMQFPRQQRKVEMVELAQRATSFAFDCDGQGRKNKPTIKEFIEGAR